MYIEATGRVNVELQMVGAGKQAAWLFSAVRTAAGGWTSTNVDANQTTPETAVFDLGAGTVEELAGSQVAAFRSAASAKSVTGGKVSQIATQAASAAMRSAMASSRQSMGKANQGAVAAAPCVYGAGFRSETNRQEPFSHVYPGRAAPATIHQSYGVTHGIGIAVGASGKWTGGSSGGTLSTDLKASGSMARTSNTTAFNSLNFNDYINVCGWTHRQVISVYAILSRMDAAAEPSFTYCTTYTSGTYAKAKGTNVTYASQVNVGPVSVNAQSGYNSETEVSWQINGKTNLCGSNDGWANAHEAEANSY